MCDIKEIAELTDLEIVEDADNEPEKPKTKTKSDGRKKTGPINAEKARTVKLDKLRKKKQKEAEKRAQEQCYYSDSDQSDSEILLIKQKRKVRRPKVEKQDIQPDNKSDSPSENDKLRNEIHDLRTMLLHMKNNQSGEGKSTIVQVFPQQTKQGDDALKSSILRF